MPHSTLITKDSAAPESRAPAQLKPGAGLDMEAGEVWDACLQPKSQTLQSDTAPSITHLDLHQRTGGDAPYCTQSPSRERQTPSQSRGSGGNMAINAQRQASAGGQGQGPARCGWKPAPQSSHSPAPATLRIYDPAVLTLQTVYCAGRTC